MAADVQLSRNFWLHEAPCYQLASEADVLTLQEITARVLQPIRNVWGPVWITSWMWWSDGCEPRTGSHAWGAVDFVTPEADLFEVFEWGCVHLMPSGFIGRWIYEPRVTNEAGEVVQGEHIHCATRDAMLRAFGDGRIMALVEKEGGHYVYGMWGLNGGGTFAAPIQIPGISVEVEAGSSWLVGLGILGALLFGPRLKGA